MIVKRQGCWNDTGSQRRSDLFLIADAPCLGTVFRGKTCRVQDRRVIAVILRYQCKRFLFGHTDTGIALRIQGIGSISSTRSPA